MSGKEKIEMMLQALSLYEQQQVATRMHKKEQIDAVLKPVQAELDAIEAEFASKLSAVDENIGELQAAIKEAVIELGESVKTLDRHAVYSKPRVTWDTKGLEGFMAAHPEIETFRKVGQPSVSIRSVG